MNKYSVMLRDPVMLTDKFYTIDTGTEEEATLIALAVHKEKHKYTAFVRSVELLEWDGHQHTDGCSCPGDCTRKLVDKSTETDNLDKGETNAQS